MLRSRQTNARAAFLQSAAGAVASAAQARWSRRQVLRGGLLAAGALLLSHPSRADPAAIRVAWVDAWETDVSRMRGVQLGLEEATDLARLLQRSFEVVPLAARDLANDPAIAALEMRPDTELRGVRIYLGPARDAPAGDPALFAVASPPARRQLALARFAAGAGARATLRVVDWHPSLVRFGAQQLNQRFERRFGARMDEDAWVGWLGVKLVSEAAFRSGAGRDELASAIAGASFDGHKGIPLRFANGVLEQPVYVVRGDQVVGEDPPA